MRTTAALAAFVLVSGAAAARAQEPAPPSPQGSDPQIEQPASEDELAARPHLQVLQHPYDISSFYRSSQSSGFDSGYAPEMGEDKYPIAGFYRSHAQGQYSTFWTNGYGAGYGMHPYGTHGAHGAHGRGFMGSVGARPLGLNGDLCLFAPTFLAPTGPLTGVFFEN